MTIAAAVECDPLMPAGVALFHVPAKRGSSAALDGKHGSPLTTAEVVRIALSKLRADLAEDVRDFEPLWTHGRLRSWRRYLRG